MNQDDNTQLNLQNNQAQTMATAQGGLGLDSIDSVIDPSNLGALQKTIIALPSEASDTDLIEKEWVDVLQEIVRQTSEDPYAQQKEISKLKADYMKKRYNKDVKQGE